MTRKTRPYREALLERLSDPVVAAHYLNAAIDDSVEMFLKALRNVAQARQMKKVAQDAGVTRESLYRALSVEGNPTVETLHSVLRVLGLRIAVEPERASETAPQPPAPRVRSRVETRYAARRSGIRNSVNQLALPFERTGAEVGSIARVMPRPAVVSYNQAYSPAALNPVGVASSQTIVTANQELSGLAALSEFLVSHGAAQLSDRIEDWRR